MGIILRYVCWGTHRPPLGGLAADRPTPKVWVNQGGGSPPPPLQPPKLSHTPWGHTLAGGSPRVGRLRQLGELSVTSTCILQWSLADGNVVALRQFRDNLMVAAKGPSPHTTMYPMCMTMEAVWNLRVLCPCRNKNPDLVCHGACMTNRVRCMGVSIFVSPTCTRPRNRPYARTVAPY